MAKDRVAVSILSLKHGAKAMSGSVKTEINRWVSKVKCNSPNSRFSVVLPAVHRETLRMTLWDAADPLDW